MKGKSLPTSARLASTFCWPVERNSATFIVGKWALNEKLWIEAVSKKVKLAQRYGVGSVFLHLCDQPNSCM